MARTLDGNGRMVLEVVVNRRHGGFSVSREAMERLGLGDRVREQDAHGFPSGGKGSYDPGLSRDDPRLVAVVRELGTERASGECAWLRIARLQIEVDMEGSDGLEEPCVRGWVKDYGPPDGRL